ncbi:UNVERIFIED_CONTAM: dihydrofolate reductase [Acetivibrio alkalicellulosi]
MKAIVSVDLNWGIGCGGQLLERISPDMKQFKQKTLNKVVVMGRETFESLPKMEPLKERINIVLSKDNSFNNDKVVICRSLNQLFNELLKYNTEDVFVIGGQSVYEQLLTYCTKVYITKIQKEYRADKYFVNLDEDKNWELVTESELHEYNNIKFSYATYVNKDYYKL